MAVVTAVSRLLRASLPFVGADSISARGCSRRRRVRRDEGIPPYGCPDGRGHLVWLGVRHGLQGRGTPLPRNPVPPQTGPILNRPLQGFAMAAVTAVSRLLRASPSFVGADSISARGCSRRRRVRRDEGIPPYGCPDGRGHLVWLGVRHGLQGRGTPLPRNPVPPQTGPILNRPLQGFAMATVTAVSRLLRASPPFVGADSISARGALRRRGVPGWLPRSSHSVGRAFTPAAHWQFQNRGPAPP